MDYARKIQEKFDPQTISKFLDVANDPIFDRKPESKKIKVVNKNKITAEKITSLEQDNKVLDGLFKIYDLMKATNEEKLKQREKDNAFAEERKLESDKRHQALIKAITGKPTSQLTTSTNTATALNNGNNLMDDLGDIGKLKGFVDILKTVGTFFLANPIGIALLAGTLTISMLLRDQNPEETNKMIQGAGAGPAGDAQAISNAAKETTGVQRRKQNILADRPSNKKSLLFWKDSDLAISYLTEVGFDEKTGLTESEKKLGYFGVDEDGNLLKEDPKKKETPAAVTKETIAPMNTAPAESTSAATSPKNITSPTLMESSVTNTTNETNVTPTNVNVNNSAPMETTNLSQKLNQVNEQNLEMKLPTPSSTGATIISNTQKTNTLQNGSGRVKLPTVRNMEETFQRMIYNSTRVV
jgi:hypothetical protein